MHITFQSSGPYKPYPSDSYDEYVPEEVLKYHYGRNLIHRNMNE